MIAVDSSSFIAYLNGDEGRDVQRVKQALQEKTLTFPPIVLTEVLSNMRLPRQVVDSINRQHVLSVSLDFWQRAGAMRSWLLAKKLKARLADTLIAQSCIDYDVPLLTRDNDFRHYVQYGLILLNDSH